MTHTKFDTTSPLQQQPNLSITVGDVGLGSIELYVIAWRATAQILGTPCLECDRLFTGVVVRSRAKGTVGDPARCLCVHLPVLPWLDSHNSMEPKPTSPITMLKFLIIW